MKATEAMTSCFSSSNELEFQEVNNKKDPRENCAPLRPAGCL